MAPAQIVQTMGGRMKDLLHRLAAHGYVTAEGQHPSTRDALATRGLIHTTSLGRPPVAWLIVSGRGMSVAAAAGLDAPIGSCQLCRMCTRPDHESEQLDLFDEAAL